MKGCWRACLNILLCPFTTARYFARWKTTKDGGRASVFISIASTPLIQVLVPDMFLLNPTLIKSSLHDCTMVLVANRYFLLLTNVQILTRNQKTYWSYFMRSKSSAGRGSAGLFFSFSSTDSNLSLRC